MWFLFVKNHWIFLNLGSRYTGAAYTGSPCYKGKTNQFATSTCRYNPRLAYRVNACAAVSTNFVHHISLNSFLGNVTFLRSHNSFPFPTFRPGFFLIILKISFNRMHNNSHKNKSPNLLSLFWCTGCWPRTWTYFGYRPHIYSCLPTRLGLWTWRISYEWKYQNWMESLWQNGFQKDVHTVFR